MLHHSVLHYLRELLPFIASWISTLTSAKCLKIVQIIALILGGIGAYVKLFKGRFYKGRLESTVTGTAIWRKDRLYVTAAASIKNIGHTKLDIDSRETGLNIYFCERPTEVIGVTSTHWEHLSTRPIFERNGFIESGETIQDQMMFSVPLEDIEAFQLELDVCAGRSVWTSRAIVTLAETVKPPRRRIILE